LIFAAKHGINKGMVINLFGNNHFEYRMELKMKLVRQIIIIMIFVFLGEFLNKVVNIPIPGNILGMVLLLVALLSRVVKLADIEIFGQFLLTHLAIFFIPASVGILAVIGVLKGTWYILLIISIVSTFVVMLTTAYVALFLRRWVK